MNIKAKQNKVSFLVVLQLMIALSSGFSHPIHVIAQSDENSWTAPVNLSHSGATADPVMVVDNKSRVHVIWEDKFSGLMYSRLEAGKWSQPIAVHFPFSPYIPTLLSDNLGYIHALWIDATGVLKSSRVYNSSFSNAGSWSQNKNIAYSVLNQDAFIDTDGDIHVAYVQNADTKDYSAGVYYRRSLDGGISWFFPIPLYQSPYLRGLKNDEAEIKISGVMTSNGYRLYAAWDIEQRKLLLFTTSTNNGQSWEQISSVEGPDSYQSSMDLSNLLVLPKDNNVLLTWVADSSGTGCSQEYRISQDNGNSWGERKTAQEGTIWCPQDIRSIFSNDNLFILAAFSKDRGYLFGWNGTEWSEPQLQEVLSGFEDPETLSQVKLGCQQTAFDGTDQIYVIGCDQGVGGDIWFTSRRIGGTSDWFPSLTAWKSPEVIASNLDISVSPVSITDKEGRLHIFWSQADESNGSQGRTVIYYVRWDGARWSKPTVILSSEDSDIDQPTVGLDTQDRLLLAWHETKSNLIKFSLVEAGRAINQGEWSEPQTLPSPREAAVSPDILVDDTGDIFVVFAIPINEDRGIYMVQSKDKGKTWSLPVRIFDGVTAGWEMVEYPQLARTLDGHLHVQWKRYALPSSPNPMALYYSRSDDGGITWTDFNPVTEAPVLWSRIIASKDRTIHRLWLENEGSRVLKHQVSRDGGLTWEPTTSLSVFGEIMGTPGLAEDSSGQLHLVQFYTLSSGDLVLNHWIWNGTSWSNEERLNLGNDSHLDVKAVAVSISAADDLGILYSGSASGEQNSQPANGLYFMSRSLALPSLLPTEQPTATLVLLAATGTPTPELSPQPTMTAEALQVPPGPAAGSDAGALLTNKYAGLLIGGAIAALIALIYVLIRVFVLVKK
jgi:hypothetical protein